MTVPGLDPDSLADLSEELESLANYALDERDAQVLREASAALPALQAENQALRVEKQALREQVWEQGDWTAMARIQVREEIGRSYLDLQAARSEVAALRAQLADRPGNATIRRLAFQDAALAMGRARDHWLTDTSPEAERFAFAYGEAARVLGEWGEDERRIDGPLNTARAFHLARGESDV